MTGVNSRPCDVIVEGGKARLESEGDSAADVTLRCDDSTFALLMYKRLTLEPMMVQRRLVVEGDQNLTIALAQWFQQT